MAYSPAILFLALLWASSQSEAVPRNLIRWPSRVIGGEAAEKDQFPYQVSVRVGNSHICGGSILSPLTILTAGHCIFASASSYSVLAGTLDLYASSSEGQLRNVASYRRHEDYNDVTLENDIALLFLDVPLVYDDMTPSVGEVGLLDDMTDVINATVSGWGVTAEGGSLSSKLMYVDVFIIDPAECAKTYGNRLKDSMICAGIPEKGGKDSCQGDSGGPLIIETEDEGDTYQVGIVSWGTGCARPGFPGVYTNVTSFNAWIQKHMKKP